MPWTVNDSRIRSLPKEGRALWVRVANGYLEDNPGEDVSAIRIAWAAVRNAGYKKEEHKWNLQGSKEGVEQLIKDIHPFGRVPVLFAKAYTAKNKKRHVVVKASGLRVDKQMERMMPSAIDDMLEACKEGKVDLLDNHFSSFEMGKSSDAYIADKDDPDNNIEKGDLFVDFEMNDAHPNTDQLYKEVANGTCKRQASVGGNVTDSKFEYDQELGKAVKQLHHVDLDHIAVTREDHSAYPTAAFVEAIAKQVHLAVPTAKAAGISGGERMEKLKALIEELKKAAAIAAELQKTAFKATPEMFEGFTLKPEFQKAMTEATVTPSKEEMTVISAALSSVLKAFGVPMVKRGKPTMQPASGAHKEAMDAHKEAMDAHKDAMDAHKRLGEHMDTIKEAMEDGAVPEALHGPFKEAMKAHEELGDAMDAHKDAMDTHKEAMDTYGKEAKKFMKEAGFDGGHDSGSDSGADSGTGSDGKEEKRPKKTAPQSQDGFDHDQEAGGPGSDGMHQGNGSAGAADDGGTARIAAGMKAVSSAMVKKLKEDFTKEFQKAQEELDRVKKDARATKSELIKATLTVQEMKKNLQRLEASPATPRPGSGVKIAKTAEGTDGRAISSLIKALTMDPNAFMKSNQEKLDQLVKLKTTKAWTPEMEKEAQERATIHKACIIMGAEAAAALYGKPEDQA